MANSATLYTNDRTWKVEVNAFKNNYFLYKSIGSEATVYHWELTSGFLFFGGGMSWVKKPADAIYVDNSYEGLLPNLTPSAARRSASRNSVDHLEEKLWAAGVSVEIVGPPIQGNPSPGGNAILEVRSVTGRVSVHIGNETLNAIVEAR